MKQEYIIKKNIFGGFNRADVIDCLASLSENNRLPQQNNYDDLKKKINQLNEEIKNKDAIIESIKSTNSTDFKKINRNNSVRSADRIINNAKSQANHIKEDVIDCIRTYESQIESIQDKSVSATEILNKLSESIYQLSEKLENFSFENSLEYSSSKYISADSNPAEVLTTENNFSDVKNEVTDGIDVNDINPEIPLSDSKETPEVEKVHFVEKPEADVPDIVTDDTFNSIDNFFAEMDKLIAAKKNPEPYLSVISENPIEYLE